jgi:hypothetical protein
VADPPFLCHEGGNLPFKWETYKTRWLRDAVGDPRISSVPRRLPSGAISRSGQHASRGADCFFFDMKRGLFESCHQLVEFVDSGHQCTGQLPRCSGHAVGNLCGSNNAMGWSVA